ncbi:MAG TPA: hypothetical protein VME67_02830 [Mycobacterium sp.]|nr:hypothetical protein [Mycobacterium sp.]HTX93855.1 hypothetical protein [Mycobacterium sp.]
MARARATGFADGLGAAPAPGGSVVPEVFVVEQDRLGADLALHALRQAAEAEPAIAVSPDIVADSGGQVSAAAAAVDTIRGLLEHLCAEPPGPAGNGARRAIPGAIPDELRDQVSARLAEIARRPADVIGLTLQGADGAPSPAEEEPPPVRVTAQSSPNGFLWSAVTGRSTVPTREVQLDPALVKELLRRLTPPSKDDQRRLRAFLSRYVVPLDLQPHLDGHAPVIIEVDTTTAVAPWELLNGALRRRLLETAGRVRADLRHDLVPGGAGRWRQRTGVGGRGDPGGPPRAVEGDRGGQGCCRPFARAPLGMGRLPALRDPGDRLIPDRAGEQAP